MYVHLSDHAGQIDHFRAEAEERRAKQIAKTVGFTLAGIALSVAFTPIALGVLGTLRNELGKKLTDVTPKR